MRLYGLLAAIGGTIVRIELSGPSSDVFGGRPT